MLKSLYYSTALALLPSTDAVLQHVAKAVNRLDARAVAYEHFLEEKAVALAHNSMKRRTAMDRVHAIIAEADRLAEKLFGAVEAAFDRREKAVLNEIGELRTKLDKASEARDAVAKVLGL